ncbi:MAG TPA: Fe-S cluster assembly ATPase SufC [Acidimicrobiia bacterium]
MSSALLVKGLSASAGGRPILDGINLEVPFGEVHALMGPNGSGKSTFCHVLTGRSGYEVSGTALLDGQPLLDLPVDERARLGLLQGFQYPVEIPGVALRELLLEAGRERHRSPVEVQASLDDAAARFEMDRFLDRAVNDDLSGGEKKRSEILQMSVLRPKVALLDEIDSGLDIDAVREVAAAVEQMRGPEVGVVMITHYSRILKHITPDRVHVMIYGRIVVSGGPELADELETGGYERLQERLGITPPASTTTEKPPSEFFTETPFD